MAFGRTLRDGMGNQYTQIPGARGITKAQRDARMDAERIASAERMEAAAIAAGKYSRGGGGAPAQLSDAAKPAQSWGSVMSKDALARQKAPTASLVSYGPSKPLTQETLDQQSAFSIGVSPTTRPGAPSVLSPSSLAQTQQTSSFFDTTTSQQRANQQSSRALRAGTVDNYPRQSSQYWNS